MSEEEERRGGWCRVRLPPWSNSEAANVTLVSGPGEKALYPHCTPCRHSVLCMHERMVVLLESSALASARYFIVVVVVGRLRPMWLAGNLLWLMRWEGEWGRDDALLLSLAGGPDDNTVWCSPLSGFYEAVCVEILLS
jgi:hypothetical protein